MVGGELNWNGRGGRRSVNVDKGGLSVQGGRECMPCTLGSDRTSDVLEGTIGESSATCTTRVSEGIKMQHSEHPKREFPTASIT